VLALALTAGWDGQPYPTPLTAGSASRPDQPPIGSATAATPTRAPRSVQHVDVYRVAGRYGGWPANHGIWAWGNEILVGFEAGYFKDSKSGHSIDYTRPAEHLLARSLDGGATWAIEHPEGLKPPPGVQQAGVPVEAGRPVTESPGDIPFTHPDFVFTARMASIHVGPSRFYYSTDRGRTWKGPHALPDFGTPGIAARTDYLVDGPRTLTIFLTAAKSNSKEGRVIAARTTDGGKSWAKLGFVHDEPAGNDYGIMPSSVRLSPSSLLTTVRFRRWIEAYRSDDNGSTWQQVARAVPDTGRGNPPSLVRLADGRLVLTYGYRAEPYGIRARISKDQGRTWDDEVVLRSDGGTWDLGYTRTVQRPDGKLVTVYYYNIGDTERFIGGTIWEP
jgi:BNR repeat-like domain